MLRALAGQDGHMEQIASDEGVKNGRAGSASGLWRVSLSGEARKIN